MDRHEKQGDRYAVIRFADDSRGGHKIHVTKVRSVFGIFSIDSCLFVISQGSSC